MLAYLLTDAAPERRLALHTALTDLHSIYTSLLDQLSTGLTTEPGEQHHAA